VAEIEATQLRQALDALTKMRVRLEAAERAKAEPIAIVGIGCRFPGGADDPESFWSLVMERRDAVTEVPADRWDAATLYDPDPLAEGKSSTRWGGFLEGIDRFDASFFGISPREAARMDPQQRLLLEVAWNAFEDAGLSPAGLAGQSAGVFVGVHSHSADYWALQANDSGGLDPYAGTGTSHSVLAGRLSYLLDLHGPSLAVDTACSSSLVAVHLACQALRAGECELALAAGVNVILTPQFTLAASRMQMLAADGRCKPFDARADGFVRGEGCGVVVLKRLTDALAAGDPIRAVIRGSGVNQDGRTNGLTAPSGPAQSALIRSVLASAGVAGREIGYVEAHGTGTPLGDPIEVEGLATALGGRGDEERCYLGSVKANVGHLEGAAGIAGLIKATLVVQHGMIPPQAQFGRLNPHISLEGTGLSIPTEPRAWPAESCPRRAGVSSFGWSGTNAHVVVEQAPAAAASTLGEPEPRLLVVSARSREALHEVLRRYRNFLSISAAPLDDIAYTAALRRAHHPYRSVIVAHTNGEAAGGLQALLESGQITNPGGVPGTPRVVFVFPGQGSQWLGMGRGLLRSSPAFGRAVEACDQALREHVRWSLVDQLTAEETASRLGEIDVVQPVLWAVQVALAAHWRACGIEPAAVVGHSMGEIAAAHVAGALTLSDAASVIGCRSRLMKTLSGRGRMALVELSRADAEQALRGHEGHLSVAVLNGPRSTVISGDPAALETVLGGLRARGVFCREVSVDVASHSPQVDALLPALRAELRHLAPQVGTIPMYSTVTGRFSVGSDLGADYWARNLREPVRFGATVEALVRSGHTTFLEISPHPLLTPAVEDTLASVGMAGTVVGSLRRHENEAAAMLHSLGALWAAGCSVAWERVFPTRRPPVALPAYPWQRERYWIARAESPTEPFAPARTAPRGAGDLYEIHWDASTLPTQGLSSPRGRWILLGGSGGVRGALTKQLEGAGASVVAMSTEPGWEHEVREQLKNGECKGVILLRGVDAMTEASTSDSFELCRTALGVVQAMLETRTADPARLWLVTRGAQAVAPDDAGRPLTSSLWGLGRVIAEEHPEVWGSLVDLDPSATPDADGRDLLVALSDPSEPEVAFRHGRRHAARLRGVAAPGKDPAFRPDASYVITGGLGALGLRVARWMVGRGARHLVLLSRSPLPPREMWSTVTGLAAARVSAVAEIEAQGAHVHHGAVDVADRDALRSFLDRYRVDGFPAIRGAMHTAAVIDDRHVDQLDADSLDRVWRPKAQGAWHLHELLAHEALDFFVLFSSLGSVLGQTGQGSYAVANAFLDGLAHHRATKGLPAVSVNWAGWADLGLAGTPGGRQVLEDLRAQGIDPLDPARALDLLGQALSGARPQLVAVAISRSTALEGGLRASRLLADLRGNQPARAPAPIASLAAELTSLPAEDRGVRLEGLLCESLGRVLRLPAERVDRRKPLGSMGIDSLIALEFRRRLEAALGLPLPATIVWNYPTVVELAAYLSSRLSEGRPASEPPLPRPAPITVGVSVERVDRLSDDEAVQALLAARRWSHGG
jgi:epothilone polyketide synthase E